MARFPKLLVAFFSAGLEIEVAGFEGRISVTLPELIDDASRRLVYTDTNLKKVGLDSLFALFHFPLR